MLGCSTHDKVLSLLTTLLFYSEPAHIAGSRSSSETEQMVARRRGLPKTGGRQKGVANKRTRDFHAAVGEAGVTPLEYMLAVLRDPNVETAAAATDGQGGSAVHPPAGCRTSRPKSISPGTRQLSPSSKDEAAVVPVMLPN